MVWHHFCDSSEAAGTLEVPHTSSWQCNIMIEPPPPPAMPCTICAQVHAAGMRALARRACSPAVDAGRHWHLPPPGSGDQQQVPCPRKNAFPRLHACGSLRGLLQSGAPVQQPWPAALSSSPLGAPLHITSVCRPNTGHPIVHSHHSICRTSWAGTPGILPEPWLLSALAAPGSGREQPLCTAAQALAGFQAAPSAGSSMFQ